MWGYSCRHSRFMLQVPCKAKRLQWNEQAGFASDIYVESTMGGKEFAHSPATFVKKLRDTPLKISIDFQDTKHQVLASQAHALE